MEPMTINKPITGSDPLEFYYPKRYNVKYVVAYSHKVRGVYMEDLAVKCESYKDALIEAEKRNRELRN
jgi:hypothetical protein